MPPVATPGFFIIAGWTSRAHLYLSGTQIKNFPTQTDMSKGRRWLRPGNEADILHPARFVDAPTGQRWALGGVVWDWPMQNLSPQMTKYLQETYFSPDSTPTSFFVRTWSNQLTVQTYNRSSGEWETYNVYGRFSNLTDDAEPVAGGWNNLKIHFTAFRIAPYGPDLDAQSSYPGSIYFGVPFNWQMLAENVGDSDTFGDSTFVYTIPTNHEYVSAASAATISIEYSTDGGTSYSPTPPPDLADVTNIRVTYSDDILEGDTSVPIFVSLLPTLVSVDNNSTFTVTTIGDQDSGNSSNTFLIDVLAFIPSALIGLRLWLSAQNTVYKTISPLTLAVDGDSVERWHDDLSGIANVNADQALSGRRPIFHTGLANSLNGITFDGVDDGFVLSSQFTVSGGSKTVFVVHDATNSASTPGGEIMFKGSNEVFYHKADTGGNDQTGVFIGGSYYTFDPAQSGLQLYTYKVDSTAHEVTFYRQTTSVDTQTISGEALMNTGSIASTQFGLTPYNGDIYEVIVYDYALSDDDLALVQSYLIDKYAIP